MDKLPQKQRLIKLFRDNGNMLTLEMIMDKKHGLGCEYRKWISKIRNEDPKYDIPAPVLDVKNPNNNLYTLIERDSPLDAQKHPIETGKPKDTSKYVNSFVTTYILLHSCFNCCLYYRAAEYGKKCKIC